MPDINSADLQINQPITAAEPTLVIKPSANQPLAVGAHTFQLEVEDNSGNRSAPARIRVVVLDDKAPTAVIDGPDRVPVGTAITLSGARSSDIGGQIVRYIWTLVP